MGLLDFLPDDPDQRRALTQGLLSGAFGAMAGRGSRLQAWGQGGLAGLAGYGGSLDRDAAMKNQALKERYTNAQIEELTQQAELRKQQAAKMAEAQGMLSSVLGQPGAPSQYGVGGSGLSVGGISETMKPQPGGLNAATPEQIAALKANGMDISNIWELARFGKEMQPGYRRNADGSVSYFGDPTKGIGFDPATQKVSVLPGAAESQAALAGATTGAQEAAKAPYSFVEQYNPQTQRMEKVRLDMASAAAGPSPTDKMSRIQQAMQANGDTSANFDLAGMGRGTLSAGQPAGGGLASGPSIPEKQAAAVNEKYALGSTDDVLKRRTAMFDAGDAAPAKIAKLQRIGQLLQGFDGGKYSPTGVDIAKTLNSVGVQIDPLLGNKEAAQAMSQQMALELRNPAGGAGMPGAMSDADRQFLQQMTPSIANSAKGRTQMIDAAVKVETRNQQVSQFARNYEKKYGKLDQGFFDQLSAWSRDNPLFGGK